GPAVRCTVNSTVRDEQGFRGSSTPAATRPEKEKCSLTWRADRRRIVAVQARTVCLYLLLARFPRRAKRARRLGRNRRFALGPQSRCLDPQPGVVSAQQ